MQARIRKKGKVLPRQRSFAMALVRDNGPNRIYDMTEWIEAIFKRIYLISRFYALYVCTLPPKAYVMRQ